MNATDAHGNTHTILVDVNESGGAELAATGVAVGTIGSTPSPDIVPDEAVRVPAGLAIAALSAVGLVVVNEFTPAGATRTHEELLTPVVARYPASDTHPEITGPVKLPGGVLDSVQDPRIGDVIHRGYGWKHIQVTLPGVTQDDIGQVLETPGAIRHQGEYTIVIGDNPVGPGQIAILLSNGVVLGASGTAYDKHRDEQILIPGETINHILNERNDWDHNQLGNSREEVERNIQEIIKNPDEIWKDPNQDRWMYVKKMVLNGIEVIVTLFIRNGEVQSAFVPTHPNVEGPTGYSDKIAKHYIRTQEMVKEFEIEEVIPEIDEGERAREPHSEFPDP